MGSDRASLDRFGFEAEVIHWRGPSPFFFAPVPPHLAEGVRQASRRVTYGWGMAPVEAKIGDVVFQTALFPKDGTYLLPLKAAVRRRGDITAGDRIRVEMIVQPLRR
jgi:hypothetical protein